MISINFKKIATISILFVGALSIVIASISESYILAFIGIALAFWGTLFLYISDKPLELVNAVVMSSMENTERVLSNNKVTTKGIYLPPKYVTTLDRSLIFIPLIENQSLPEPEQIDENALYSENKSGLFFTPPGFSLSKLFEEKLKTSFKNMTLDQLLESLPSLLIEKAQIANKIDIEKQENTLTITVHKNILSGVCREMNHLPITHKTLGCLLTSAIACAIAKAVGKPVVITKEEKLQNDETTKIYYQILDN